MNEDKYNDEVSLGDLSQFSDFNGFFTLNAILDMNIAICNYKCDLVSNNEDDIEYKITIFKMKYLEKPEIYKSLPKQRLDLEKQSITAKFREIIDRKSRNIVNKINIKKIEDDLYS